MGICESKSGAASGHSGARQPRAPEPITNKPSSIKVVPMDLINKLKKSVCKIKIIKNKKCIGLGTGFFMYLSQNDKTQRYLLTNYHVFKEINGIMELEINGKNGDLNNLICKIDLNNHYVKNFEEKKTDVSLIKINDNDLLILDNVNFLNYDINYQNGYEIYKNKDIFSLGYPKINRNKNPNETQIAYGRGNIIDMSESVLDSSKKNPENAYPESLKSRNMKASYIEFEHNIETVGGSSGSPIVILDGTEIKIVGIHKLSVHLGNIKKNFGTFIGFIMEKMKDEKNQEGNFILSEINVNEPGIDIQIINSDIAISNILGINYKGNDAQIKQCEIMIDGNNIPFSYTYKFSKEGKHTIIYSFKEKITDISHLFYNCSNVTYLDFSHFNSNGISSMKYIFHSCTSLTEINLLNLNTEEVTDMTDMFNSCKSLTKLDLSGFNTKKVTNMTAMFYCCTSLKSINLQSFNTENVTDMNSMFYACESLKELNLSNFNTKNVTDMSGMFFCCRNLKMLDLSSFNTEKVINMGFMFGLCETLNYLDLTNFNTRSIKYMSLNNPFKQAAKNMTNMFGLCSHLKAENVKVKDRKILEALELINNGEIDFEDINSLLPNFFI